MAITQRAAMVTAADAASSDQFGRSVAVSADGAIMAVGANLWEGAASNQGGVYILDWSGSAWVARGSVLVASDAASGDSFGDAVSLSDDGAILVVGAPTWEGAASNMGGVYVFDWSGSAWVQRGSVLTASGAGSNFQFGVSVCLSGDGAMLAVGAPSQGSVFIYDWSGSAWVQRGATLVAADFVVFDYFGSAVALSGTGTVLAVGASQRQDYVGGVYLYDWSGSAWVQRGSVLKAADFGINDLYGSSVALSSDGTMLAVGAPGWAGAVGTEGAVYLYDYGGGAWTPRSMVNPSDAEMSDRFGSGVALSSSGTILAAGALNWEGAATDQGGVYVFDLTLDSFASAATALTLSASTGTAVAATELTLTDSAVCYSELTLVYPSGSASVATALTVSATGSATAATALALMAGGHIPNWTARCLIDGVDVSARLEGVASVMADEGAARIARLVLNPSMGTIVPLDYVGKSITLDYVPVVGGVGIPLRLFTGRIDTPRYDPNTRLLSLDCVDDLQNRIAELPRSVIDGLVGGRYTPAVQGDILDNWDYAAARLSTVAASLDAGPSGGMRVTLWSLPLSWATYGEADLLYQRTVLQYPQRSTLINKVSIEFSYRYPRLRQRYTTMGWSGTQIDMAPCGYAYPKQQDILGAANGTGWEVTLGVFYPAPASIPHASGGFIVPDEGSIDMAILHLTQRHSQTVTESYTLTVNADESVAANGALPFSLRGALESTFDGNAWESALDVLPFLPGGGEIDHAPDATRTDADYAIQTLLDQANVKILGSHRGARVINAVLCNPDIDLDKRITIATADMAVSGKLASVTHTLDFGAGSAVTEFSIACFGAGGAGILTPDVLAPPTPPAVAAATQDWAGSIPPLYVNTFGVTPYNDNLMGLLLNPPETVFVTNIPPLASSASYPNPYFVAGSYPVTGYRVRMPGVDDPDRNPLDKPVAATYSILIPSDTLTFTVP